MAAIDILFDCMKSIAENLCILSQKFQRIFISFEVSHKKESKNFFK